MVDEKKKKNKKKMMMMMKMKTTAIARLYLRMNSISGTNTPHQMQMCDHITSEQNKIKSISFNNPSDVIDPTTITHNRARCYRCLFIEQT